MNYLETGLPHTEFYKRKSDFIPPRYKPLCSLGRRYLGLEPLSKSELNSFVNRLCQPKKPLEPENQSKPSREGRPVKSGTGRFNGRKRMTGNQIDKMVERLNKRKTEAQNEPDNKMKGTKPHPERKDEKQTEEVNEEEQEGPSETKEYSKESMNSKNVSDLQNSKHISDMQDGKRQSFDVNIRREHDETNRKESAADFKKIEEKMIEFLRVKEERNKAEIENVFSTKPETGLTLTGITANSAEKKPKKVTEEERYESLYYRGVKTEIARKFFNENYKRSSVQMAKTNRADSIKSAKTDLISSPRRNSKLEDISNRKPRPRSKTA